MNDTPDLDKCIAWARYQYAATSNDDLEIDDEPATSEVDDGVWIAAWVWVPYKDVEQ